MSKKAIDHTEIEEIFDINELEKYRGKLLKSKHEKKEVDNFIYHYPDWDTSDQKVKHRKKLNIY